jgi:hypothetical protein
MAEIATARVRKLSILEGVLSKELKSCDNAKTQSIFGFF